MTRTEEYQNALNGYRNLDVHINKTLRLIGISAIEKQIPKKPIIQETTEKKYYKCPYCNKIFVEAYDTVQRGYIPKYCDMCGQSIEFPYKKEGK